MLRSMWLHKLLTIYTGRARRRQAAARTRRNVRLQLEALEDRVTPAVFTTSVDSVADLKQAIDTANNGNSSDQYVINLQANTTFNLDATQEIGNGSNNSANVIIKGLGGDTITPATGFRAFRVDAGAKVEFDNLTISGGDMTASALSGSIGAGGAALFVGGDVTLDHVIVADNTVYATGSAKAACGGGIYVTNPGNLTIRDGSEITGNRVLGTEIDGTNQGASALGGGIYANGGSSININISDSTLSDNIAQGGDSGDGATRGGSGYGAVLYSRGGAALQLTNVTVEGNRSYGGNNTAGGDGGNAVGALLIENIHNQINLVNVEVTDNQAIGGNGATAGGGANSGGLFLLSSYASTATTILNSSFYSNKVQGGNGATGGDATGGAIFGSRYKGTFNLFNSTVAQNIVQGGSGSSPANDGTAAGGGLAFTQLNITPLLYNDTIVFNQVTGNSSTTDFGAIFGNSREENVLAQGNISNGDETNSLIRGANNIIGGTLQVSNSPTTIYVNGVGLTVYPLLSGVQAIGFGTTDVLPAIAAAEGVSESDATDEAGKPRTAANGTIDIGALQFNAQVTGLIDFNAPSSFNLTYGATQTAPFALILYSTATGQHVNTGGTVFYSVVDANGTLVPAVSTPVESGGLVAINAITLPATPLSVSNNKYFIQLQYYDLSSTLIDSTTIPLDIAQATTTTTSVASSPSTVAISSSPQTLTVTANVTASGVTVNEGQVTFRLIDSNGITILDTSSPANVNGGVATSTLTVPANQTNGVYTIVADYNDTSPLPANFTNSTNQTPFVIGVTSATLVNTTPPGTSLPYGQNLSLPVSAKIYSGDAQTPVTEGKVTFTLTNSAGVSVASLVDNNLTDGVGGTLSTASPLPVGVYQLVVSYDDSANHNNFTAEPTAAQAVSITPAQTKTTLSLVSTPPYDFSSSSHDLQVSASVALSGGGAVGEGKVTFTLYQGGTVKSSVQADVDGSGSTGDVSLNVPANLPVGSYTIVASYSDAAASGNFADSTSTSLPFTIEPASTTLTPNSPVSVAFSLSDQQVAVSAKVTSSSTVTEGQVTFSLLVNGTVVSTVQANVVSGQTVPVNLLVPAGTAVGQYQIQVSYADAAGNFASSDPDTTSLRITPATATLTTNVTPTTLIANATADQLVTVSAHVVTGPNSTPVNEGTVTFTLFNGNKQQVGSSQTANVSNGTTSSLSLLVPKGTPAGTYTVRAVYSDGNFFSNASSSQALLILPTPTPPPPTTVTIQDAVLALYVDAAWLVLDTHGYGAMFQLPVPSELIANIQYNLPFAGIWGLPALAIGHNAGNQIVGAQSNS